MKMEEKRAALIAAGIALFKEKGYEKVSVEEICARIHVTKPTFYNRIGHKEMILIHWFNEQSANALPEARQILEEKGPRAAFPKLFSCFHQIATRMGPELYAVYSNYILQNPDIYHVDYEKWLDLAAECIRQLQEENAIESRQDPMSLASLLMQINDGLCIVWASQEGSFDLQGVFCQWSSDLLGFHEPFIDPNPSYCAPRMSEPS